MTEDTMIVEEIVDYNCATCGRQPNWRYRDKVLHKKITKTTHILSGCPFVEVTLHCIRCTEGLEEELNEKLSEGFRGLGSLFTSEEEKI